jgi:transcription elongation GreA/GreB family factor
LAVYRIVGEDEADPAKGRLAYVAPLAQALLGKSVGDDVSAGAASFAITAIS